MAYSLQPESLTPGKRDRRDVTKLARNNSCRLKFPVLYLGIESC